MGGFWLYHQYPDISYKLTKLLLAVLIVSAVAGYFLFPSKDQYSIVQPHETATLQGTLLHKPSINYTNKKQPSIELELNEYPNSRFKIEKTEFKVLQTEKLLADRNAGDSMTLKVLKYHLKWLHKGTTNAASIIPTYALWSSTDTYLSLEDVNTIRRDNINLARWFLVISLVILAVYAALEFSGILARLSTWWNNLNPNR